MKKIMLPPISTIGSQFQPALMTPSQLPIMIAMVITMLAASQHIICTALRYWPCTLCSVSVTGKL